jgi:hypothetical protein
MAKDLLQKALAVHGGLDRWNSLETVQATIEPCQEDGELWGGLRVTYPPDIASHGRQQDFYFGPDFLLRRHDYHVEASGGFAAAQYVFNLVTVQGITLSTKRRGYMRNDRCLPMHDLFHFHK